MTTEPGHDPGAAHQAAIDRTWHLLDTGHRAVVVDSPPGAGKSTLVRAAARRLAPGAPVPIVTQTNDQADDHVRHLAAELAGSSLTVGRLHRERYDAPAGVPASNRLDDLRACDIIIAPADKWAFVDTTESWPIGIIDEAYQVSSAHLVRVSHRLERLLLVGDPGQLSPFTTADERTVRATGSWPLDTAAGAVQRTHPDTPTVQLPVSWRLPHAGARIVADAFYTRPFTSGATADQRGLRFPLRPLRDSFDRALAQAAAAGWCFFELPEANLPRTDPDCVAVIATLTKRLLASQPSIIDGKHQRALTAADIAVGVTHRDQKAQVEAVIDQVCADLGIPARTITVATANRLQGRQYEVVIAWHPLSGRRDASSFHLEAGRLCVLASRHRHACIVVGRAGIREQLDAYPHTEPVWLGSAPPEVDGWEANHRFIESLQPLTVPFED